MTCKIQWIDARGNPTPDENPAIGFVQCEAYRYPCEGAINGFIQYRETEWFPICREHAARLTDRGMHHWHFKGAGAGVLLSVIPAAPTDDEPCA